MSIDYRLTLSGDVLLEELADLVAPGAAETLAPGGNRVLSADLDNESGYVISLTSGMHGYYEAEADGAVWQWEPATYVDITFHMNKDTLSDKGRPHMLRTVAKILTNTTEDAALILNDNWLLLTRSKGKMRKHNTTDWYDQTYDDILPD
ncbi:SitI3 family protein [Micromonospora sp. NPDC049559]|uniref:SitI3 family protein n=1 Tax=Micromonospora sp. NPDC049559 TaxID=3155923 RepID=UPI0034422304